MTTTIETFIDSHARDGEVAVSRSELRTLWQSWFGDESSTSDSGWEVFVDVAAASLDQRLGTDLRFGGAWEIRARSAVVSSALSAALLAGALAMAGIAVLPAVLLPTVLPLVFDIEHVELSAGDRYIVAELRTQPRVRDGSLTTDEIYGALPADLKAHTSRADLADFVERCRRAGVADIEGESVLFRDPARPRFRVSLS
jgi:hypothetical protein